MRQVMEKHVAARVILGGNAEPRTKAGGEGYGGRYPGVVEEAWRSLDAANPLYVAGGFGGAAGIVADLLEGKDTPEKLRDKTWSSHAFYKENAGKLDAHPTRKILGLPKTMKDLARAIVKLGGKRLKNDSVSIAWNGLLVEENCFLFRTRDPVALAALISKGLLQIAREREKGRLQIELVHDSLTSADKLDAIAVATLDGVPLGGAGAVIDRLTGGSATDARSQGRTLVSLKESLIDADWLFLASLGELGDPAAVLGMVEQAALETAHQAARHGFQRVGVVTFAGNVVTDTEAVANAMVQGFAEPREGTVFVWYETDEQRFHRLLEILTKNDAVKLTTRRSLTRIPPEPTAREPLILNVRLEDHRLSATCLPPSSAAAVFAHARKLTVTKLSALSEGRGQNKRATPSLAVLEQRGPKLAELLFGEHAAAILTTCRDSRMIIVHDTAASRVPFEMLFAPPGLRPAIESGITRRLSVSGLAFERQFARPPKKGKLKVLLIANPTQDLAGAAKEAEAVKEILKVQSEHLDFEEYWEKDATVENVTAALQRADILHYCGHAFFDGPGPAESGLVLAGKVEFNGEQLAKIELLPRMAFVNACEAGRVRGAPPTNAVAFAELFLHSGMDAYLGTYWEVGDAAAALFAGTVYTKLAIGDTLEQATLAGRKALFAANEPDWANYLLYGGGNFRLVTPDL
jgi:CHAT domain-containing protein